MLDDEGLMVIAVPNKDSYDAQFFKAHWAAYDVPRHLWHFDPACMQVWLEKFGLKVIAHKGMPLDPWYVSLMSARYRGGLLSPLLGLGVGMISFLRGAFLPKKCSSVIYFVKKD